MEPAEVSARFPSADCDLCGGTGVIRWQQPTEGPEGLVLRELEHPCTNGCSGWWRMPAAERGDGGHGLVAEANNLPFPELES